MVVHNRSQSQSTLEQALRGPETGGRETGTATQYKQLVKVIKDTHN